MNYIFPSLLMRFYCLLYFYTYAMEMQNYSFVTKETLIKKSFCPLATTFSELNNV